MWCLAMVNQEKMIRELIDIKNLLEQSVSEKQKALEALKAEIAHINDSIAKITGLISDQSFVTADIVYENEMDFESQPSKLPKEANYSRKIFDAKNVLICTIIYRDGDIIVSFPDPKEKRLTFFNYVTKFIPLLKPVKDVEPDIMSEVKKVPIDGVDIIKEIIIKNIQNYETIETIERELKKVF